MDERGKHNPSLFMTDYNRIVLVFTILNGVENIKG